MKHLTCLIALMIVPAIGRSADPSQGWKRATAWIVPDTPDTGGPRDHYRYIEIACFADRGAHWAKSGSR